MLTKRDSADAANARIKSILGQDAVFEGTLSAKEATRIDGLVKGDVKIESTLVLGVSGRIVGNVNAATIMVGGQVEGDLVAGEKIVISATGRVNGNLHTKKLIVDENAVFHGQCFMGGEKETEKPAEVQKIPESAV